MADFAMARRPTPRRSFDLCVSCRPGCARGGVIDSGDGLCSVCGFRRTRRRSWIGVWWSADGWGRLRRYARLVTDEGSTRARDPGPGQVLPPPHLAVGMNRDHNIPGEEGVPKMTAKFMVIKGSTGKFHFNLVATNGQVIATSESYESKAAALNGIESVKKNAPTAQIDDQTTS